MKFNDWFNLFLEEKEIDEETPFEFKNNDGIWNYMPAGVVIEFILSSPTEIKKKIKEKIVLIDFCNGDIYHFFKDIAQWIANNKDLIYN